MKIAIIYASRYGTTAKIAKAIADKLKGANEVELFSLKDNPQPDISVFEVVIIGGSIYAGQVSKKIKTFCKENENLLLQKKIGLFISGMEPDKESQEKELKGAFSEVLLEKSEIASFLGGEFLFEKMNFFFRMIAQKIAKAKENVHQIDKEGIEEFAKKFQ